MPESVTAVQSPVLLARPTIAALTGIRILAAGWVVLEHFRQPLFALLPATRKVRGGVLSGYLGVEVFFILSGFIISYNYAQRMPGRAPREYRRFLRLRFARLYPVHLATLAMVAVLVLAARLAHVGLSFQDRYTPVSFLMNLLLLQAVPPAAAWNSPAWSISTEAAAYAVFPLIAFLMMRSRGWLRPLVVVVVLLAVEVSVMQIIGAGSSRGVTSVTVIWLRIAGEFTTGCFLWAFWSSAQLRGRRWDGAAVAAAAGTGVVLALTPGVGPQDFYVLPLLALFVLSCAAATGPVARLLSSRLMEYGGRISYSLYMVHFLVLMIGGKVLEWNRFTGSPLQVRLVILLAYFAAALLGAIAMYHLVEEPGRRRLGARAVHGVQSVVPQPSSRTSGQAAVAGVLVADATEGDGGLNTAPAGTRSRAR